LIRGLAGTRGAWVGGGLTDDVPDVNAAVLRAVDVHVDQRGLCPFTNEHPVLLGLVDVAVPDDEEDGVELKKQQ
jgi:hypothetical protein